MDGFLLSAGVRIQSVVAQSSCEAEQIAATAATSEAKCMQACGRHVNIHVRSDSTGAIGVASRRGLQRLRHLDVRFLWLQSESAAVAGDNSKPADTSSHEFCRLSMGVTQIPEQAHDAVL